MTETGELLREMERQAAGIHQEGGGSEMGVMETCEFVEASGVPVVAAEAGAAYGRTARASHDRALDTGCARGGCAECG